MDSAEVLKEIAEQVTVCEKCNLHFSRKKAVPGEGPSSVELMFIGEGPGFYENELGRPFVGQAGKFLDELLARAGVSREKVFITNVVKCRPPGNHDPEPEELSACRGYLERQIEALNPRVIVTLGRFSMAHFLPYAKISSAHGKATWVNGRLVVAMYHPAAALHQPSLQETVLEDFSHLPEFIKLAQKTQAGHVISASAAVDPAESTTQPAPAQPHTEQHSLLDILPDQAVEPPAPPADDPDDSGPVQLSLF
ncbi:uracil-DNA glycosylase, family 4 [Longilinea arvoryzae]|uniref:Type-4 uracil-DNA glycosylase n=1 Tax=Longilinea arvoryzae TaxID=360412 RepID=A0A0S7BJ37_9CHLR|nr:uracil-DNA glycosylase [Longilinea arvoryzae]GAP13931.1 uracil-DNA glycosylase, family 4 [Longilinea arvoryzae]